MLLLVETYGHYVSLIKKDVCRHKCGVGEETCVYILRILRALVLELSHSRELTEHGVAVEYPAELSVLRHVRLYEEGVFLGIKAASHVERESLVRSPSELCGYLSYGNCVKVNYAIKGLIFLAEARKVLDRAEVVSYREVARGLYSGENYFLIIFCHFIFSLRGVRL